MEGKSLEQDKEDGAGAGRAGARATLHVHARVQPYAKCNCVGMVKDAKGAETIPWQPSPNLAASSVNVSLHVLNPLLELVSMLQVYLLCLSDLATANGEHIRIPMRL